MMEWIESLPPWLWITLVVHGVVLGAVAYLILLERKVASWVQDRLGPNRVGPFGLLQPLADGLKFILKEDYRPAGVDPKLFTIAPAVMIIVIIISIAVIPWGGAKGEHHSAEIYATGDTVPQAVVREKLAEIETELPRWHQVLNYRVVTTEPADGGKQFFLKYNTGWNFQIASLNIGVLFILGVLSLAVYGVVIGGWASNNKYSFLGGLRATANMISYEIPLGLAVLTIVVLFGTLDLGTIVDKQAGYWLGFIPRWNVLAHPLAFVMFLICIHAEANRAPFDVAEAEQELVGGYHTEYSSMRFALFFLAEYAGMITTSAVCVALFFGGWHLPWIDVIPFIKNWSFFQALAGNVDPATPSVTTSILAMIVRSGVFFGKTILILFFFMWVRWSLPRFRFDQIMELAWRALIPISLFMLMTTAIAMYAFGPTGRPGGRLSVGLWLVLLLVNVITTVIIMAVSKIIPPAPATNRRIKIPGSRFENTPIPATSGVSA